jgi:short-subunit dehydrogenase
MKKVALVTGASSGIGLSVAKKLASRGWRVALVARTAKTLEEVAKDLGADRAVAYPLDVKDLAALAALPARVKRDLGRLDLVVNNAGLNHRGPLDQHDALALADVVTTNLTAPIVLSRAAVDVLERGGSIVQVASIAGMVPVPHEATYSASKAGLRAFSRAAAYDLEERGIHVGTVCPGPVDTGFLGDIEHVPDIVLSQPMVGPDEVADEVLRCMDERRDEIAIPRRSGRLATVAYLVPELARRLRPALEKKGAKNKRAILAKKRG